MQNENPATPTSLLERLRQPRALAVLLFLTVLCAFLPAIKNDFINYDDPTFVTDNPGLQHGFTSEGLKWAFTATVLGNWHPVTNLSHLTDYAIFGLRPWGHHFTNVVLHALNAVLLFLCLRLMTDLLWRPLFAAAFFGLHPLRVESVAWVAERKDVLCGVFFFLTLIAYARYAKAKEQSELSANKYYALTLAAFTVGLLAKSMLVTLPCLLLLLDFWPLRRFAPAKAVSLILEKLPFVALSAAISLITMRVQAQIGAVMTTAMFPLNQRVNNALVSYWRYLGKTIWPAPLAIPYPFPKEEWTETEAILAAAGILAVCALAWALRRRQPYLAVGWLWYVGMLIPVIGLVQVGMQSMADRYTYLPGVGLCLILAWGVFDLTRSMPRQKTILTTAAVAILLACGLATQAQLAYWSTSDILFSHSIAVTPDNAVAYSMLGGADVAKGDDSLGSSNYLTALALRPHLAGARRNYAMILQRQGRIADALEQYEMSTNDPPPFAASDENNLGVLLAASGQPNQAEKHFRRALELNDTDASAWVNIGRLDWQRGDTNKAIVDFRTALRLDPKSSLAHDLLKQLKP